MNAITKFAARYRADNAPFALEGWDEFAASGDQADWMRALQKRAVTRVQERGLPTTKLERFKYFNLPSWLKKQDLAYNSADLQMSGPQDYVSALSDAQSWVQDIITMPSEEDEQYGDMLLLDYADAYINDGFVIDVPAQEQVREPITLTATGHNGQRTVAHSVIRLGVQSEAVFHEYQMGSGAYWQHMVHHIHIAAGGVFKHFRFQENSEQSAYTPMSIVRVDEGARYEAFTITTGAQISRNHVHVILEGPNSSCAVNGINLLNDAQVGDTTITVEHRAPHCVSHQNYRSVIDGKAVGTFQGKVHVHQIAQKTDGYQLSNALLLSDRATMNNKPELEIYADDVKCSHGTTSGQLDKDALFYMQARGIPENEARALLIQAFVAEVLEDVTDEAVREQAEHIASRWLANTLAPDDENEWSPS